MNYKVNLPLSKSYLHRYLLIGLTLKNKYKINITKQELEMNDIKDTLNVLKACDVNIKQEEGYLDLDFQQSNYKGQEILLTESGTTLRMALIILLTIYNIANFKVNESLYKRPLTFYKTLFQKASNDENEIKLILNKDENTIKAIGNISHYLNNENLIIDKIESSQYISGLMFSYIYLAQNNESNDKESNKESYKENYNNISNHKIIFTNLLQSKGYLEITKNVAQSFNINFEFLNVKDELKEIKLKNLNNNSDEKSKRENNNNINLQQEIINVPFDASSSAFWKVYNSLVNKDRKVNFENFFNYQPDLLVDNILEDNKETQTIDFKQAPDLFPILCVYASLTKKKITFTGFERNALKESNRIDAMLTQLKEIGIKFEYDNNKIVFPKDSFQSPIIKQKYVVESFNDHRITMSFAIMNLIIGSQFEFEDKEVVNKSYPLFWEDYKNVAENRYNNKR